MLLGESAWAAWAAWVRVWDGGVVLCVCVVSLDSLY